MSSGCDEPRSKDVVSGSLERRRRSISAMFSLGSSTGSFIVVSQRERERERAADILTMRRTLILSSKSEPEKDCVECTADSFGGWFCFFCFPSTLHARQIHSYFIRLTPFLPLRELHAADKLRVPSSSSARTSPEVFKLFPRSVGTHLGWILPLELTRGEVHHEHPGKSDDGYHLSSLMPPMATSSNSSSIPMT